MFKKNILTFSPGWNAKAHAVEVDNTTTGLACLIVLDPDDKPVMLDHHI